MKLDLFHESDRSMVDGLYLALLRYNQHSLLPELYSIFGQERTFEFLQVFAGQTIKVPEPSDLEHAVRDVLIHQRLAKTSDRATTVSEIAKEYELSEQQVTSIETSMKELLDGRRTLHDLARRLVKSR